MAREGCLDNKLDYLAPPHGGLRKSAAFCRGHQKIQVTRVYTSDVQREFKATVFVAVYIPASSSYNNRNEPTGLEQYISEQQTVHIDFKHAGQRNIFFPKMSERIDPT